MNNISNRYFKCFAKACRSLEEVRQKSWLRYYCYRKYYTFIFFYFLLSKNTSGYDKIKYNYVILNKLKSDIFLLLTRSCAVEKRN